MFRTIISIFLFIVVSCDDCEQESERCKKNKLQICEDGNWETIWECEEWNEKCCFDSDIDGLGCSKNCNE